jgi:hypothetical protein
VQRWKFLELRSAPYGSERVVFDHIVQKQRQPQKQKLPNQGWVGLAIVAKD